jgi:hypothetical protein
MAEWFWMSDKCHVLFNGSCAPLAGLHHFYFANLAQTAYCKYRCTIPAENSDTLS